MSDPHDDDNHEPDEPQDSGLTNWQELRDSTPLNDRNVAAFTRLNQAQTRLHDWWEQRQATTTWLTEALGSPIEETTELWIAALGDKIAAMGGHLELTAVFENETLTLLREPGLTRQTRHRRAVAQPDQ